MTQFKTFTDEERAALELHGLDTRQPSQLSDAFVIGVRYALTGAQPAPAAPSPTVPALPAPVDFSDVPQIAHVWGYTVDQMHERDAMWLARLDAAAPAAQPATHLTDEELADCGLLSEIEDEDEQPPTAQPAPAAPKALPRHKFWGAGEPDCPQDIKAPNGELHTMRCKVCGDGWRKSRDVCFGAAPAAQPADSAMTAEQIEALAHREAWRYVHGSSNPNNCANSLYTFNRATLLEFARALVAKETPHAR